jgi:peptidoglycan hydrolase-like protein with peptidoglycan-binding domain
MKRFWLILTLIIISSAVFSQDLTGIWRGSFYAGIGPYQEYYKYEVQINQLKNYSLQGVTYSYRSTVFYGKATFEGIWFPKSKNALVKELKLVELKMTVNSDACAMTCNLDYSKQDGKEILSGTFTSINANSKADCGSGSVYLERVQESDFHKEDFLLNKKPAPVPSTEDDNPVIATADQSKTNTKRLQTALGVPADGVAGPKTIAALKKKLPDFNDKLDVTDSGQVNKLIGLIKKANTATVKTTPPPVVKDDISKTNTKKLQTALGIPADGVAGPKTIAALKKKLPDFNDQLEVSNSDQVNKLIQNIKKANASTVKKIPPAIPQVQNEPQPPAVVKQDTIVKTLPSVSQNQNQVTEAPKKLVPVPEVIKTRSNPLVKTIITNLPDIQVELYDNGDVDGDTITVYDNNQVIAWKKGLTDRPITLNIKADANTPIHELVMVADNLGTIPPNTALMVVTTGGKRYQVFISSDTQKNAKVVIDYQP